MANPKTFSEREQLKIDATLVSLGVTPVTPETQPDMQILLNQIDVLITQKLDNSFKPEEPQHSQTPKLGK